MLYENNEIFVLFDYCHLLECFRNQLIKHALIIYLPDWPVLYISLSLLIKAYEEDKRSSGSDAHLSFLRDEHMYEHKCPKMKVEYTAKVFCNKLSKHLNALNHTKN